MLIVPSLIQIVYYIIKIKKKNYTEIPLYSKDKYIFDFYCRNT